MVGAAVRNFHSAVNKRRPGSRKGESSGADPGALLGCSWVMGAYQPPGARAQEPLQTRLGRPYSSQKFIGLLKPARDDDALDVAGALIDLAHPDVTIDPLHRKIRQIAIAAMNLDRR